MLVPFLSVELEFRYHNQYGYCSLCSSVEPLTGDCLSGESSGTSSLVLELSVSLFFTLERENGLKKILDCYLVSMSKLIYKYYTYKTYSL